MIPGLKLKFSTRIQMNLKSMKGAISVFFFLSGALLILKNFNRYQQPHIHAQSGTANIKVSRLLRQHITKTTPIFSGMCVRTKRLTTERHTEQQRVLLHTASFSQFHSFLIQFHFRFSRSKTYKKRFAWREKNSCCGT